MASQNISQLVDEQARRWAKAHQDAQKAPPQPSVAVSRLPFSGAADIAQKLGARLDFGVFGREIVDKISSEEGVSKSLVQGLDEHVESAIERHVLDGFRYRKFTESDYLRDAVRVISTLGMRGRTIVLGRGGISILPPEHTLRVLVVAPTDWRRARLAQTYPASDEEIAARLEREDKERTEFWKQSFDVDFTDPGLYDLTVNSATLTIDGAVDLIASAFRQRFD